MNVRRDGFKPKGAGSNVATKSRWPSPDKYPHIVVDNFFNDPDTLVRLGKTLPNEVVSRQPGRRSKQMWEIDEILHNAIIRKTLSCYYDLDYVTISWATSNLSFHTIDRYDSAKESELNKGWIHQDVMIKQGFGDDEVAGLVYLTPGIDQDSGTSLWTLKPNVKVDTQAPAYFDQDQQAWINEDTQMGGEEYITGYKSHMEKFTEKLRFQNVFNRMIMYDSREWHAANSYYHEDGQDPRLTLAFFIGGIESLSDFPLERIRNPAFDDLISARIGNKSYI